MVVKMMKWRPWPPLSSKKFETKIIINRIEDMHFPNDGAKSAVGACDFSKLAVEINWKGSKAGGLTSFRKIVRRNFTKEEGLRDDGVVEWNEEFVCLCNFACLRDGLFQDWEVVFTLFAGFNLAPKGKAPAIATASLNLVQFASASEQKDTEIIVPLSMTSAGVECSPSLSVFISLSEVRTAQESPELVQRSVVSLPVSPISGELLSTQKDDLSGLRAGLKKVKIFKALSTRSAKKACREEEGSDGRSSSKSEDTDYNYPFDTDSVDEVDDDWSEEGKDDYSLRKSLSYETLAYANHAGELFYSNNDHEDWIYYSPISNVEDPSVPVLDLSVGQSVKRSIFPWRKRKLSFRSPKAKGEPLLKKDFGEEGGDDIDFDRRQISSDEYMNGHKSEEDSIANRTSVSEFGDDNFVVGSWAQKEVLSRDGHMKLQTQVFFASIDQRSERASGESACTALVAVIADWFQNNGSEIPIKSQFDSLIRDGSLEWRNLCENEAYSERFPDKHFDLETVLEAKIRPVTVVPEKSFIGFFRPDGLEEGGFDFLDGAMSYDNMWDEIRSNAESLSSLDHLVYIVSWNDHFFILKVERDAYYIIDTLGERLYEGCNQAYVLKFDKDTVIQKQPTETETVKEKTVADKVDQSQPKEKPNEEMAIVSSVDAENCEEDEPVVCRGKESCKEYIKSFLAAIPIGELLTDMKKGLKSSTLLHHRLQIEFHYSQSLPQPVAEFSLVEQQQPVVEFSLAEQQQPVGEFSLVEAFPDAVETSPETLPETSAETSV